jgi:hypothetical protein
MEVRTRNARVKERRAALREAVEPEILQPRGRTPEDTREEIERGRGCEAEVDEIAHDLAIAAVSCVRRPSGAKSPRTAGPPRRRRRDDGFVLRAPTTLAARAGDAHESAAARADAAAICARRTGNARSSAVSVGSGSSAAATRSSSLTRILSCAARCFCKRRHCQFTPAVTRAAVSDHVAGSE